MPGLDQPGDKRSMAFWRGLVTGVAIPAVALALTAGWVSSRGLVVGVEKGPIIQRVADEVRAAVREEMPRTLESLKSEVPSQVAAETRRRLTGAQIELAGFEVELPAALVQQVEQAVDQALRSGLDLSLRQVDLERLADQMGDRAAVLAQERLEEGLQGQRLTVELLPGFQVPVQLRLR